MTISTRAVDIGNIAIGLEGGRVSHRPGDRSNTLLNSAPQARQVSTIVIDTAVNSHSYDFTLDGNAFSFLSDASATKLEVITGLKAAIEADPTVGGLVSVVSDGIATLTLTARRAALAFVLLTSDANVTLATPTAAASADAVPFARAVVGTGWLGGNPLGGLAKSALLTAQVDTLTTTYVAAVNYQWVIDVDGKTYTDTVLATTDTATTLTAIAASINAAMPASTVLAAAGATSITLTAEIVGLEFSANLSADDGGASVPAITLATNKGEATSFNHAFRGVSLYRADITPLVVGGAAEYRANEGVEVLERGQIYIATVAASGDDAWVELGASNSGSIHNVGSATRVRLSKARFIRYDSTSGLAVLELGL